MAKATLNTEKVSVTTYEEKKTVTLELSWDEARLLRTLFGDCASQGSIDRHVRSLFIALKEVVPFEERFLIKYSPDGVMSHFVVRGQ